MKIKLNHRQTALSVLLLFTTSFVQATPVVTTVSLEALWQWLFPEVQQPEPSRACESFPRCQSPPFAPVPESEESVEHGE